MKSFLILPFISISLFIASQSTVPVGTVVSFTLNKEIYSPKVKVGDPADFVVSQDVVVNGKVVIPANTKAKAKILEVANGGPHQGEAKLKVQIYEVQAVDGSTITLDDCFVFTVGDGGHKQRGALLIQGIGKNCLTKKTESINNEKHY